MRIQSPACGERSPWWLALGCGLICGLMLLQSHFRLSIVVGESMLPTFNTGDFLLVDKHAYRKADPRRGDIVIARYNEELIVKRIVGLPGEVVEVNGGTVYINRAPIAENHEIERGLLNVGRGKLFGGKFAILGDNRAVQASQAVHPIVSKDQIVGRVIFSIRPCWRHHRRLGSQET